jgi:hypothetical protein
MLSSFLPVSSPVANIGDAFGTLLVGCVLAVASDGVAAGVIALFLIAAPATAVALPLKRLHPLVRTVLALAAAVVVNAVVAEAMLATGRWSTPGGVAAVAVISAVMWLANGAVSASSSAAAGTRQEVVGDPDNNGGKDGTV